MSKKVKVTDLDLNISTGTIIYLDIDTFRFLYNEEMFELIVQIENNGSFEFLEEIELAENEVITDHTDLERFALNWVFDNVEVVKEIKEETAQEVRVQEQSNNIEIKIDGKEIARTINQMRNECGLESIAGGDVFLKKAIRSASKNETLIGIDPNSYLGIEILKQSREIISQYHQIRELKAEVKEIKEMTTEIISRLHNKI